MPKPAVRPAMLILPLLLLVSACDIVTAELKHSETAEWRKTFELAPGGRVEIININGQIQVDPSSGNTLEVVAVKTARGSTVEDAKRALERVEIVDTASGAGVRIETRIPRQSGWFTSSPSVRYSVRVPPGANVRFATTNGGVELRGISGTIEAETTNGGITARDISGSIEASTTNGGVDVDLARLGEGGARLGCTNGGIRLRLPSDARASISARITNGGIDTGGITLDASESSRRSLEARMNGGGPSVRAECTNGGFTLRTR
jgi:bifunctional DNA-binding transcriptional regulator/antitoxin component of YhaV-PrlF toxin-antitoxin module